MLGLHKHIYQTLLWVALAVTAGFAVTACSDSDSDSSRFAVKFDAASIKANGDGAGGAGASALTIAGREGSVWAAKITSGAEWLSFSIDAPGAQLKKDGTVSTGVSRMVYIYFWPNATQVKRNGIIEFSSDGHTEQIELVQYAANGDVYATGRSAFWPEVPAQKIDDNYLYVSHFAPLTDPGTTRTYNARNYTLCFDKTKAGSWWVAYPLHNVHTGTGRTESWQYDPLIPQSYQANLTRSYPASTYDRGHQIPNADRSGNAEMQAQTYYFSNMTPQNYQLNQQPWARLEAKVRSWICTDTLYVVTGAYWDPQSTLTTPDRDGKLCPVPTSYYKVVVRTKKGNIRSAGDLLGSYKADQLMSIGFWVDNASGQGEAKQWVKSVKEIEQITGFEFFPSIPASVKTQKSTSAWGL